VKENEKEGLTIANNGDEVGSFDMKGLDAQSLGRMTRMIIAEGRQDDLLLCNFMNEVD